MPPAPTPPPRRVDDRLVPALATQVAVLQNDVGHIREAVDRLVEALDEDDTEAKALRELVERISSDATASAAGRDLLGRAARSEEHHAWQDRQLDEHRISIGKLEDDAIEFHSEIRGALVLLRAFAGITTIAASIMSILWAVHLLGWIH